jgi:hypothetical protein
LVEISVPRGVGTLLGRYWQALLLMFSIIMIVAGLLTAQPTVSGGGWTVLLFVQVLFMLRTLLSDYLRAGDRRRALIRLAALTVAALALYGGLQAYNVLNLRWKNAQNALCEFLDNCPTPPYSSAKRDRD